MGFTVAPQGTNDSIQSWLTVGLLLVNTTYLAPCSTIHWHSDRPSSPDKPTSKYVRSGRNRDAESTGRILTGTTGSDLQCTRAIRLLMSICGISARDWVMTVSAASTSKLDASELLQAVWSRSLILAADDPGCLIGRLLINDVASSGTQWRGRLLLMRVPTSLILQCLSKSTNIETCEGIDRLIRRLVECGWI